MVAFSLLMIQRCNLFFELLLVAFLLFLSFGPVEFDDGNSRTKKVRGPNLVRDIWKLPLKKIVEVSFNSHNQTVGKEGRKLASFLGIVARSPELTHLHANDWRIFYNEEKKKLLNFVRV
ncbi:hypothetical protein HAX54_000715 [Datura stramonium]|uniref:Uncharacterized protein n=1 Tax=Datura stramonium TaxID=4076 RepID=A0ABS8T1E4_DATST|nr:hypothetical protein [Datura stramonium]